MSCAKNSEPANLTEPVQDIANFLLVRGPYAFLGHGWLGCSRTYEVPEQLSWDNGEPLGLCSETAAGSEVFHRAYSKANVTLDCKNWVGSVIPF